MKYIGNKNRLLGFIDRAIDSIEMNDDINEFYAIDLFSGTGSVANYFRKKGFKTISNDMLLISKYERYRTSFWNEEPLYDELSYCGIKTLNDALDFLNNIKPKGGYYYDNYGYGGKNKRQYFEKENAQKIDAISEVLDKWKNILPDDKFSLIMGIFIDAVDKVSNTAGTYGAFLKIWRPAALNKIILRKPKFEKGAEHKILTGDSEELIKDLQYPFNSIVYIDPPYNTRQYFSNYHVLENIAAGDKPELVSKTGVNHDERKMSNFSRRSAASISFKKLINSIDAKYIIVSYSNEGIIDEDYINKVLREKGNVRVMSKNYRRFKTNSNTEAKTGLEEKLYIVKCK